MIVGTPYIRLITCSVLATFSELTYLVCAIHKLGKIKIWNWFSNISSTSTSFLININIVQQHHHDHHSPLLRGKIKELCAAKDLVVTPLASSHLWWGGKKAITSGVYDWEVTTTPLKLLKTVNSTAISASGFSTTDAAVHRSTRED